MIDQHIVFCGGIGHRGTIDEAEGPHLPDGIGLGVEQHGDLGTIGFGEQIKLVAPPRGEPAGDERIAGRCELLHEVDLLRGVLFGDGLHQDLAGFRCRRSDRHERDQDEKEEREEAFHGAKGPERCGAEREGCARGVRASAVAGLRRRSARRKGIACSSAARLTIF